MFSIKRLPILVLKNGFGLGEKVEEEFVEFGEVFGFEDWVAGEMGLEVPGELLVKGFTALLGGVEGVEEFEEFVELSVFGVVVLGHGD
jgi:hypothetical protein